VGLASEKTLTGANIEAMDDAQLADATEQTTLFVRLSPAHKRRIIHALQAKRHVVGFMGDGINDAPALRAADVGISVDTAVDIAKEAADAILLEKSLMVLEEGVLEGRAVFGQYSSEVSFLDAGASRSPPPIFSSLTSRLGAAERIRGASGCSVPTVVPFGRVMRAGGTFSPAEVPVSTAL